MEAFLREQAKKWSFKNAAEKYADTNRWGSSAIVNVYNEQQKALKPWWFRAFCKSVVAL